MPSGEERTPHPLIALTAQMMETWHWAATKGMESAAANLFSYDPRQLRTRWLTDLSRTADEYMRSPLFLQLMQHGLGTITRAAHLFSPLPPRSK